MGSSRRCAGQGSAAHALRAPCQRCGVLASVGGFGADFPRQSARNQRRAPWNHSRHSSASLASPFSSQAARRKSDSSFKLLR